MKSNKENCKRLKKNILKQPWAFVLCAPIFQITFLKRRTLLSYHHHRWLHQKFRCQWSKEEKKKCKTTLDEVLKPAIYIYTDMNILFLLYSHIYAFVHPLFDNQMT